MFHPGDTGWNGNGTIIRLVFVVRLLVSEDHIPGLVQGIRAASTPVIRGTAALEMRVELSGNIGFLEIQYLKQNTGGEIKDKNLPF